MDIVQLRTFLSVAETGSFSAAGQALNSVQSNITTRIRKLEDDVGGALFERGRGGAQLTPLGERLMPHARDILHRIDTARADVLDAAGQAAPLRLGALETTAGARLPPVMKALYGRHPSSEITLQTGTSGGLMADVWARRLDAAFVGAPVDPDRFNAIPAYTERLLVARPRDAVAPPALLAFPSGCIYRAAAEAWLQQSGKADMTVRDLGSLESILGLVEAGLGFTVAPETAILGYRAANALDLTPLPAPHDVSETVLCWRIDHRVTAPLRSLRDLVTEERAAA